VPKIFYWLFSWTVFLPIVWVFVLIDGNPEKHQYSFFVAAISFPIFLLLLLFRFVFLPLLRAVFAFLVQKKHGLSRA
jgi:hypothetical protein